MDVYLKVVDDKQTTHETRELVPGVVMADYDVDGNLLGIEVLGVASGTVDGMTMAKFASVPRPHKPLPFPDDDS